MTFLSGSFKLALWAILVCCHARAAAQDNFFEFFISDYPHPLKAFQFSSDDRYFLVSKFHQFESTPDRLIPSHYKGKVYEVKSGKLLNTVSSKDAVRWLPGTDHLVVVKAKRVSVLSINGDTLQSIDLNDKIKKLVLSPDGTMLAACSERDSISVHNVSGGKPLKKLNTRITGFQYPEFTGNNQYLIAQTGASWAWEIWNLETTTKLDSFRLHDRFWLKPKQYFVNKGDYLLYLNDLSKRKMFTRQDSDVFDDSARMLARTYGYRIIEIFDLKSGTVIQHIPLNANETWKVLVNAHTLVVSDLSGKDSQLRFFNVEFGEEILALKNRNLNGYMDFHPGKSLFLATSKEEMLLFQCEETAAKQLFERRLKQLYYARFSQSGDYVIALADDKIELYRTNDGARVLQVSAR